MAMVLLRRVLLNGKAIALPSASPMAQSDSFVPAFSRFFSKSAPYAVKVGIPEFLQGIGGGVEAHVAKLESEIGDFNSVDMALLNFCPSYEFEAFCW
ncbi:uncharacterized protein LOC115685116 isoform X2 [Syzygium oleosum]|uniref:uncharacterized protein LOC115685116 isoform X2 n=1 Tax=Syzygium oleosum TaxID=219896 RepID=UPI0024BAC747|nr:uncharacterized protein LOC115685116 isoform X2 [Syzygium oleosum]